MPNVRAVTALTKPRFTLASGEKINDQKVAFQTPTMIFAKHSLDDRASSRDDCGAVIGMVQTSPILDWQTTGTAGTLGHVFVRAKTQNPHHPSIE
jgi:hypothetical protein